MQDEASFRCTYANGRFQKANCSTNSRFFHDHMGVKKAKSNNRGNLLIYGYTAFDGSSSSVIEKWSMEMWIL